MKRVRARVGTFTNCAGISQIDVEFYPAETMGVTCETTLSEDELPACYRDAAYRGMQSVPFRAGLRAVIVGALVHEVDAREERFYEAGQKAVREML